MQIQVLCFAAVRDALGATTIDLELETGATVGVALERLATKSPALLALLPTLRVAVNEEFAAGSDVLQAGATLALLPPMSGG